MEMLCCQSGIVEFLANVWLLPCSAEAGRASSRLPSCRVHSQLTVARLGSDRVNKNNMAIPQEVADKVQQKLAEARDGTKLVSTVDAVLKILQAHSLAWRQTILPPHVGVHQMNRDGLGLNSSEVHALIDDVLSVGFARDEVRGVCFEVQHSNEATRKIQWKDGCRKRRQSRPLGCCEHSICIGGRVTFKRWIELLAPVNQATRGQPLSLARLQEIDAEYYKACMEGTSWLVVSSQVESKWPELPGMIQAANNTASHLSRTESELQLLRKIWHCTVAKQEGGKVSLCWWRHRQHGAQDETHIGSVWAIPSSISLWSSAVESRVLSWKTPWTTSRHMDMPRGLSAPKCTNCWHRTSKEQNNMPSIDTVSRLISWQNCHKVTGGYIKHVFR